MTSRPLPSTIAAPVEFTLEAKKSVFLARLEPAQSVEAADAMVARVRKDHWDARHHCVALIIGSHADRQRSNDDGEPAGTAGAPMLEVLRHRDVTDLVAVVTRWFGGTLLGAGGLVRAYGGAVSGALDRARLVERVRLTQVTADAPQAESGRIVAYLHQWARAHGAVLDEPTYGRAVSLSIRVTPELVPVLEAEMAALTGGEVEVAVGDTAIVDRPAH